MQRKIYLVVLLLIFFDLVELKLARAELRNTCDEEWFRQNSSDPATKNDSCSLPEIHIVPGTDQFLNEKGEVFVPWGYQYLLTDTYGMIEDHWDLESTWKTIEEDFEEMKTYSANIVRIHLQYNKFMLDPETPNPDALNKLERLIKIAEDKELYLDITGLCAYRKSDSPLWYDELDEQGRWASQARFWKAIAATVKDSPAVFAYDLMNEPVVPGKVQTEWLHPNTLGGYSFVQFLVKDRGDRTREEIFKSWISQMACAIRTEDPKHFITVGYLSAFFPPVIDTDELDYISIHIYPRSGKIQEYADYILDSKKNKPLVLEELDPLFCSSVEMLLFLDKTNDALNGVISYYDGKSLEEKAESGTIIDALGKDWIEKFMERKKSMTSENNHQ